VLIVLLRRPPAMGDRAGLPHLLGGAGQSTSPTGCPTAAMMMHPRGRFLSGSAASTDHIHNRGPVQARARRAGPAHLNT